jgi:hypothetical protein
VADDGVGFGGHIRRGGASGADCPNGLVGDNDLLGFGIGDIAQHGAHLVPEGFLGAAFFALAELLSDAGDGRDAVRDGRLDLQVDALAGLTEVHALLGVA